MIRPEELRIGNWVYNPAIRANMQVYPMMIPQLHRIVSEGGQPNIEPIPLTPEILEKCGFSSVKQIDDTGLTQYRRKSIYFETFNSKIKWSGIAVGDEGVMIDLNHLHQLQNLFYALTGEELEVML